MLYNIKIKNLFKKKQRQSIENRKKIIGQWFVLSMKQIKKITRKLRKSQNSQRKIVGKSYETKKIKGQPKGNHKNIFEG